VKRFQRSLRAGCTYFLAVFAAGWAFGPIREAFVSAGVEPLTAVFFEAPAMLLVMYLSSALTVRGFQVSPRIADRLAMGAPAMALMLVADLLGGWAVRGWRLQDGLAYFATSPGVVFAVLLILGLLMPALQMRDRLAS